MLHLRLSCVIAVAALVSSASAQEPKPIRLWLTPAKPPTPALRYQLLPDARITISGNAAPLYRKAIDLLVQKQPFTRAQRDLFDQWDVVPLDKLPTVTMRKVLAEYDDLYAVLDQAARCDRCDWQWLDRWRTQQLDDSLRELQATRELAQFLVRRIRLEMADGRLDKTLVMLRNGMALARHVGESDTLIGYLVGVAITLIMEGQLDQFAGQPGAPNLYYALTELPAPLISMRRALKSERVAIYYLLFPQATEQLLNLDSGNLTPQQLEAAAKLVRDEFRDKRTGELARLRLTGNAAVAELIRPAQPALVYLDLEQLARDIQDKHPVAKQALIAAGRPRDKVEAMPLLQVALLHTLLEYEAALDEYIVWQQLPFWEMNERLVGFKKQPQDDRRNDPNAPALPLLETSGFKRYAWSGLRINRKAALLRTVEALRFYAATHDNCLARILDAVKEVPLPLDPMTGKSFAYQLDGDTATLRAAPPANEPSSSYFGFTYQLRIRK